MKKLLFLLPAALFLLGLNCHTMAQCNSFWGVAHHIQITNKTFETQTVNVTLLDVLMYNSNCQPLQAMTCGNTPISGWAVIVPANSTVTTVATVNPAAIVAVYRASSCPGTCSSCSLSKCATYSGICNSASASDGITCSCDAFSIEPVNTLGYVPASATTELEIDYL